MKPKTIKITYWIFTILFALFILIGAVTGLMQTPQSNEALQSLGYPTYLNTILGVAKILGIIAIIQWKYKTIKEWAYAGFTIDILGASASMYFSGAGIVMTLFPLIVLAWMFGSYFLWKKVESLRA